MPLLHRWTARLRATHCAGLLVTAMLCLCAGPVAASDPGLAPAGAPEEILDLDLADLMRLEVETSSIASKYTQKVSEAPASISIVTADEIRKFGYRTLADILRGVRGLYVSYDRNYPYLGVRGFSRPGDYNTRVLVMINGQRLNNAVCEQGSIGSEMPLDVDLIERVEVSATRAPRSTAPAPCSVSST